MSNHISEAALNNYFDELLSADEAGAIQAHLETCQTCRNEAHALGGILAELHALPQSISPARDLRPGIAERLAQTNTANRARRAYVRWLPLSAAAVLLIVASSLLTRHVVLRSMSQNGAPPASTPVASTPEANLHLASFRREEMRYIDQVAQLQRALERERDQLSPETLTILQRNLTIIDRAIAESRAALDHDPANHDLSRLVISAYQQKITLLRGAGASGT